MDLLDAISTFVSVSELGSFSSAARRNGVSVSSVTRSVSALEKKLGTTLLRRSTHRISLTDAGQLYLKHARAIVETVDEAAASVSDLDTHPRGTLHVHAPVTLGRRHVSPMLPELLQRYPELQIDLTLSDTIVNIREERVDVALRIVGAADEPGAIVRTLVPNRRFVVASPVYLASHPEIEHPSDIRSHPGLLFAYAGPQQPWLFRSKGKVEEIKVRGRLRVNNSEVLLDSARAGCGLALLPEWLVAAELDAGTLVHVLAEYEAAVQSFDSSIVALYMPRMRRSQKVLCFVKHLALHLPRCLPGASATSLMRSPGA